MALLKKKTPPAPAAKRQPTLEERLVRGLTSVDGAVSLATAAVGQLEEASASLREVSRDAQLEAARLAATSQRALVEAEAATRSADAVKVVVEGH